MKARAFGMLVGLLASSATLPATQSGTELEWSLNTAVGHTDNVTLVETDTVGQTVASIGGKIDLAREGSRLNATLRGDGSFLKYLDDAYDDEFLGSAATTVLFGIAGDSLTWTLDDTFGQTATDDFRPSTPDNRGNVNVFSTGPDLRLPIGRGTDLVVSGRFQDSNYEVTDNIDSQTWTATTAIIRRVSTAVSWSLNGSASRIVYDDANSASYNKQELFAQLSTAGSRQTLLIDLGIGFLDQADKTDSNPLVRINWTRRLTPSWKITAEAASQYQNSSDQFVGGVSAVGDEADLGGTQDIILTDQVQRNDSASLSLVVERPRTALRLFSDIAQERFPDSSVLDRDRWSVGAEASRRVTQRLQAFVDASYEKRDYAGSNEDDSTTVFTAGADWRLGRVIFLGLEGGLRRRSGNTGFDYDETVYRAILSYRPSGR
jgi:hypothetical protein